MSGNRRAGSRLIGLGIGLVALSVAFGFAFELLSAEFIRSLYRQRIVRYPHLFFGLFDPFSVGVVYLIFGVLVVGWTRATRSARLSFAVVLPTTIIAVVVVFGIELASSASPTSSVETIRETVATTPSLWVGYYLAWLLAYEVASTRRQRAVSVVGIAVLPSIVSVYGVRAARSTLETGGPGAGLGYVAAAMAIATSLIGILVAIVAATPWAALRNRSERRSGDEPGSTAGRRAIRDRRVPDVVAFLGLFLAVMIVTPMQFVFLPAELTGRIAERAGCGQPCYLPILLSRYVYAALFAVGGVALGRRLWNRFGAAGGTVPRTD